MLGTQFKLNLNEEVIIDEFAGGGGASLGIEIALKRHVDFAVNHDPTAVAMHRLNHPQTKHLCQDVFNVDPLSIAIGRAIGFMWFSPDCRHFAKAAGDKPKEKKIRGLAWVALNWVNKRRPRAFVLENVSEFMTWGPLVTPNNLAEVRKLFPKKKLKVGSPNPAAKGRHFRAFVGALRRRGYDVDYKEISAKEHGVGTIRKRFFLIARCDGRPIVWPEATHAPKSDARVKSRQLNPYGRICDLVDFSLPTNSIVGRNKPLTPKSIVRLIKGVQRYVIDNPNPFIAPIIPDIDREGNALAIAHLFSQYGQSIGRSMTEPCPTIVSGGMGKTGIVVSYICKMRNGNIGHGMDEPLHPISAVGTHHAEVRTILTRHSGGIEPIVVINGEKHVIYDIQIRMLQPSELFAAQGFPADYIHEEGLFLNKQTKQFERRKLTKTAQVRLVGNSVCPAVAAAIVYANVPELSNWDKGEIPEFVKMISRIPEESTFNIPEPLAA